MIGSLECWVLNLFWLVHVYVFSLLFHCQKIKINLLVYPKVKGRSKIRGQIRSFQEILPYKCALLIFGGNWNMVCSVYFAPPFCMKCQPVRSDIGHLKLQKMCSPGHVPPVNWDFTWDSVSWDPPFWDTCFVPSHSLLGPIDPSVRPPPKRHFP